MAVDVVVVVAAAAAAAFPSPEKSMHVSAPRL